jgi:hypothetical protein
MAKKTEIKITPDDLNEIAPPNLEDEIVYTNTPEFSTATSNLAGPGMHEVLAAAGTGASVFNQEGNVNRRFSQGRVEAQNIAYTPAKETELKGFAESLAALECPGVQEYASAEYKERLRNIATKANLLSTPDVVASVGGERIIVTAAQQKVGTLFDTEQKREEALDLLDAMLGDKDSLKSPTNPTGNRVVEVVSCARTAGITFVILPIHWLSQQLAVETSKTEILDFMPTDLPYIEEVDGQLTNDIPAIISKLFSGDTARKIHTISKMHRVSMLYVLRYLVDKVCENRRGIVTPSAGKGGSKYNDLVPQIKVPA